MQQNIALVIKAAVLFSAIGVAYFFIFQKYDEANTEVTMIRNINTENDAQVQAELEYQNQ